MKRVVAIYVVTLCLGASIAAAQTSYDIFNQNCSSVSRPDEQIRQCTKLLEDRRLGEEWAGEIYRELAYAALLGLRDTDRAIGYARSSIEKTENYYKSKSYADYLSKRQFDSESAGMHRRFPIAKISHAYWTLGTFEERKALELATYDKDYASSLIFAKSALSSFSKAIAINSESYEAYAGRAKILSWFCRETESQADYNLAIAIAIKKDRLNEAKEYRDQLGRSFVECWEQFRGK